MYLVWPCAWSRIPEITLLRFLPGLHFHFAYNLYVFSWIKLFWSFFISPPPTALILFIGFGSTTGAARQIIKVGNLERVAPLISSAVNSSGCHLVSSRNGWCQHYSGVSALIFLFAGCIAGIAALVENISEVQHGTKTDDKGKSTRIQTKHITHVPKDSKSVSQGCDNPGYSRRTTVTGVLCFLHKQPTTNDPLSV